MPRTGGTVGTFRQPTARRPLAKQPPMLRDADAELELDAFVAREQRQETVRRRRGDDFDDAAVFETTERADEIFVDLLEQPVQPLEPPQPIVRDRFQPDIARLG